MQPAKQVSQIKNEIYIQKDSLRIIQNPQYPSRYQLVFQFDANFQSLISVYLGHQEKIKGEGQSTHVEFQPIVGSKFYGFQPCICKYNAGKNITFPDNIVGFDMSDFIVGKMDFTRARGENFPIIIHMRMNEQRPEYFQYEVLYNLQLRVMKNGPCQVEIATWVVLINGQVFKLQEAFGLNSNRTDSEDSKECVICLTNRKEVLQMPCKHVALCSACAQVVMRQDKKCAICRQSISFYNHYLEIDEVIPLNILDQNQQP